MKDQVTLQKLFGGPALQTQPQRPGKPPKFSTLVKVLMVGAAIFLLIGFIYVVNQTIKLIDRIRTPKKKELTSGPPPREVIEDITFEEVESAPQTKEAKGKDEGQQP